MAVGLPGFLFKKVSWCAVYSTNFRLTAVSYPTTMNTRDEFRNVSVTEVGVVDMGVVDTRYGVSQSVGSRRLNAGWLSCCYSRRTTRQ